MFNNDKIYYIVELMSKLDNIGYPVLCSEDKLADFLNHYDKDTYQLMNVNCVGNLDIDGKKFLKENKQLEHGSEV